TKPYGALEHGAQEIAMPITSRSAQWQLVEKGFHVCRSDVGQLPLGERHERPVQARVILPPRPLVKVLPARKSPRGIPGNRNCKPPMARPPWTIGVMLTFCARLASLMTCGGPPPARCSSKTSGTFHISPSNVPPSGVLTSHRHLRTTL